MFRGSSASDKLIERATSKLTPDIDLASMVELNDLIMAGKYTPSNVISTLAKKLRNDNPNVVHKALEVLDSLVKNCGSRMYKEVASDKLIHAIAIIAKTSDYSHIRTKALELIQIWTHAFGKLPEYIKIKEMYILLKSEGIHFPPLEKDATALFDPVVEVHPEMRDVKNCYRCRADFGLLVKKHRCEKCGNIFCAKCTSHKIKVAGKGRRDKTGKICDMCAEAITKDHVTSYDDTFEAEMKMAMQASVEEHKKRIASLMHPTTDEQRKQVGGKQTDKAKQLELEQEEKEQIELAIALSKSEAEEKERRQVEEAKKKANSSLPSTSKVLPTTGNNSVTVKTDDEDPMLARYMDRSYWETRRTYYRPGSPGAAPATMEFQPSAPVEMQSENDDTDKFAASLREQMELFVNRMKSNSSRGRHISNDSTVQNLFNTLIPMHNELMSRAKNLDDSRGHYENLQDKMSQIKEARNALDELRNEHQMQKQWVAAEQKYMSQIQMHNKLMELRQKKQIYLRTQEEMAIRQIQDKELELTMNAEQKRMMPNPYPTVMQPPSMISQSLALAPQIVAPAMFVAPPLASTYAQPPQPYLYMPNNDAVANLHQDHRQLNVNSTPMSTLEQRVVMNQPTTTEGAAQTSVSVPHVSQTEHHGPLPGSNSEPAVRSNEVSSGTSCMSNSDSVQTGTVNVRKEPSTEQLITFD